MALAATTAVSTAAAAGTGTAALNSLAGNFQTFLKLLMTQLKNQDPTSPLDTNQFTSQLVQFASVEQQINTNSSLGKLIELTQNGEVLQSSAMVGRQVEFESDRLVVQEGAAAVRFTAPAAGRVALAVYADNGTKLADGMIDAARGENVWAWNGRNAAGLPVPDGSYRVSVTTADPDSTARGLPFTVLGTASAVQQNGGKVQLQVGAATVDFAKIRSVRAAAAP